MSSEASRLDKLANVSFVIVCALLSVYIVGKMIPSNARRPAPPYKVGDRIPAIPGVRYEDADQTVVLFVQSECKFCLESMPFYQRLANTIAANRAVKARLVVASFEETATTREYLDRQGVHADSVARILPGTLVVSGTPTLFLVDRLGKVQGNWIGKLDEPTETQVLKKIS